MLQDEKYCGNYLYQKTFKTDPLTKQAVKNTGQLPQYLIEKVHDGIITEETHKLVQEELKRRNDIKIDVGGKEKIARYSSTYALSERLYCADCKSSMRRKVWKNRDKTNRYVWVCSNRIKSKRQKCNAEVIDEYRLHDAIIKALNIFTQEKRALDEMIERNMAEALANNLAGANPLTLKNEVTVLEKAFIDLIALSIKSQQPEMFEEKFKALSDEIAQKREQYEKAEKLMKSQEMLTEKLQKVQQYIELTPSEITEYDDMLVRQTIKRIAVMDVNHIKITFIDDREIIQTMEERK